MNAALSCYECSHVLHHHERYAVMDSAKKGSEKSCWLSDTTGGAPHFHPDSQQMTDIDVCTRQLPCQCAQAKFAAT
jgi:hypothetical protein